MTTDSKDPSLYPYTPPPPPPPSARTTSSGRRPRSKLTKTAAGLAVVLGAGAGAAAVAQATTSSGNSADTTTTTNATSNAPGALPLPSQAPFRSGFGFRMGGPGPLGMWGRMGRTSAVPGQMGAIHGQFTIPGPNGGYETIASQIGTVESVSSSSITLKSADGYTQAYDVNPSTVVNADYEGILSVGTGDTVTVEALVSGSTYTAEVVTDVTQLQANRKSWAPERTPPTTAPPTTTNPTSAA